jgi:type I restriction-modification system DNA methylase subunit
MLINIILYLKMINDKTAWFAFLHSLADIIRNGKSKFTGNDALNEMNNLLLLRFIQHRIGKYENNKFIANDDPKKFGLYDSDKKNRNGLDEECMFDYIYNKYCINYEKKENKFEINNELYELLYGQDREYDKIEKTDKEGNKIGKELKLNGKRKSIFMRLLWSDDVGLGKMYEQDLDMNQFIHKITGFTTNHVQDIIELIRKIHDDLKDIDFYKFNYDGFGDAYEKYKADDAGNGKTHGQYFTRRDVIELIVNELKPQYNEICYDPACGTGGFLHGFDTYVKNDLENDKDLNKKYKEFKKNIYGREIEAKIYKALMFNMMIHQIEMKNIEFLDSLSENNNNPKYQDCMINKADVVGANPPFGMSFKNLYDPEKKLYPILVKNSVCLFLQHIMNCLKKGGRAGIVIDRGILNNGKGKTSWENKLRKYMLENNNLYKIILLPTGIFSHTNFATAIVFFKKGEKTKEVEFIKGYFKEEDKGKGLKTMYLKDGIVIDINKIKEKEYSLKLEDYTEKKVEKVQKGWVKLADIVEIQEGYAFKPSNFIKNNINVIKISNINNFNVYHDDNITIKKDIKYNKYTINFNDILICLTGSAGPKIALYNYNKESYINQRVGKFILKDNKKYNINNIKIIYYFLLISDFNNKVWKIHFGNDKSNGQPNFSSKKICDEIMFPSLSIEHQQEIVDLLDEIYRTYKIEDTVKYFSEYNIFNLLIEKKYDEFKNILWYQEQIPRLICSLEQIPRLKKDYIRSLFNTTKYKEYKLGDVVEIEFGTRITKGKDSVDENEKIKYPVYGGGDITFYTKDKNRSGKNILISRFGVSPKCVRIINDDIFINDSCMSVKILNKKLCMFDYLGYYLLYNQEKIFKFADGQGQKNMMTNDLLKKFILNIPSLEEQEKIIKEIEKIESTQSTYADYAKSIQTQIESINKVIENLTQINKDESKEEEESSDSESENEQVVKPKKKVKQIKKVESSSESESDNDSDSSEEDTKPKKIVKPVKKIELSDEKPKKKVKPIKKAESSSSESDSSSDSSSESSSEDLKPKKKVKPVNKSK